MKPRFITYEEIIENYYGGKEIISRKKKRISADPVTFSKVFDNGENLIQKEVPPSAFEEYVVQSSLPDEQVFEEYVVQSSLPDQETFEEYVVSSSAQQSDTAKAYSSSLSVQNISPSDEYQFDLMGSLSDNNDFNTNNPNTNNSDKNLQDPYMPADSIPQIGSANDTQNNNNRTIGPQKASQSASTDSDFEQDFKDILQGKKLYDKAAGKTVDKAQTVTQQPVQPPQQSSAQTPAPATEFANGHAIFDEIAKKMKYATAYDLGAVEVDKRFNDFDKIAELQRLANEAKTSRTSSITDPIVNRTNYKEPEVNTTDFIKDLDAIRKGARSQPMSGPDATVAVTPAVTPDVHSAGWPPRPTNLRPLRTAEKMSEFGEFTYVDDPSHFNGDGIRVTNDWATQNIISVSIPQLNGKTFGKHVITNGTINFHKNAADRLRNLWAAWENAGLIDRILTFEGGYAARYVRATEGRSPRPISNHSWGTAFDINAAFNRFGGEPALVGQRGSVRELVTIANQNGFFWGGHFPHPDGMHFEIGHSV